MEYLKSKILFLFMTMSLALQGQTFVYSYVDPCTKDYKTIVGDMSTPIIVVYYAQSRAFSYTELNDGTFDLWMNTVYNKYKITSPCQGAAVTTTTTTTSNQTITLVGNITNLISLDFSSLANAGVNINIGSTANNANTVNDENKDNTDNNTTETNSQNSSGNNQGSNSGSGSSSGSNGSGSNGSSTGGGNQDSETPKEEIPEEQSQANNRQNNQITKATSNSKQNIQKPAIILTGDIVGIQNTNSTQDARGTVGFTRVKGDGSASLGINADYMVNARIANVSLMRSWISTNQKGHKGINVLSGSATMLPGTYSATAIFVRVNSLKKFTALYGAAGTYGIMKGEPLISTLALGGAMYKGKLTKALDGTFILVAAYSPYMKYYTESVLESQPILLPFVNLTYKLSKTFGFGLTGGGTYVAGAEQPLNYQVLLGAKLIL